MRNQTLLCEGWWIFTFHYMETSVGLEEIFVKKMSFSTATIPKVEVLEMTQRFSCFMVLEMKKCNTTSNFQFEARKILDCSHSQSATKR